MRYLTILLLIITLLAGCTKDVPGLNVGIYLLKSFTRQYDPQSYRTSITDAVLEETPLITKNDFSYYKRESHAFKLKSDIRPAIKDFNTSKGFAVTVNGKPIYYGIFHPAYLSSMTIGLATIDPIIIIDNELAINFVVYTGGNLEQYDKRNDAVLTDALSALGKLK